MNIYQTTKSKIPGTSFKEVYSDALLSFKKIKNRTKRTPYIKSKYFKGQKIFINIFWQHLFDKREKERTRRLKYFDCGIDLIRNTSFDPETKDNPNKKSELLHRFLGITKTKEKFFVQIKQDKKGERKDLMSIFPDN